MQISPTFGKNFIHLLVKLLALTGGEKKLKSDNKPTTLKYILIKLKASDWQANFQIRDKVKTEHKKKLT